MNWGRIRALSSKVPDELWYSVILLFTVPMEGVPSYIRFIPVIGIVCSLLAYKFSQKKDLLVIISQLAILIFTFIALFYVRSLFWTILLTAWVVIELGTLLAYIKNKLLESKQ